MPVYFKQIAAVPAIDIVAHRILWSLIVLAILLSLSRSWNEVRAAVTQKRTMALLAVTSLLIGVNWMFYVYAINTGHILAGSLGYYLNPLANILLGRFILGSDCRGGNGGLSESPPPGWPFLRPGRSTLCGLACCFASASRPTACFERWPRSIPLPVSASKQPFLHPSPSPG
ncbi:hypothetical protein G7076_01015 [Sphingomonas sp. HDW15A]|uniref:EamA family transporter n=1 Tax=Sphingomonas sp. HDW15A TaxID=2714942 RepID=UPI00140BBB63|nr:hypothetical protein [Sphingomonas sp. HDW15A]QIK97091.1 hypothetical protein G7076_01015 [Sphingomonas sp. HDW15A]